MPLWRKLKRLVVINDVPDEETGIEQLPAKEPKPDKKKKDTIKAPDPPPPIDDAVESLFKLPERSCMNKICCNGYYQALYFVLLCFFLGLLLPFILTSTVLEPPSGIMDQRGYCYINDTIKYSCRGDNNVTKGICEKSGCCYEVVENTLVPNCFHSEPSEYGYNVYNSTTVPLTDTFIRTVIEDDQIIIETVETNTYRLDNDKSMTLDLDNIREKTPYGGTMWPLRLLVERGGDDVIRLTMFCPGHEEGTLIRDSVFSPSEANNPKLNVEVTHIKNEAFNVTVYLYGNKNAVLFSTLLGPVIFGDGYMEITTTVPSTAVYGLGSRADMVENPLFDKYEQWTLNSRDPAYSNTSLPATHPFFLALHPPTKTSYGVYIRTSTPVQIGSVPAPGLSFRTTMGSFKVLVIAGPEPKDVSRQYTSLVGRPTLPPYWAFGFHLCRTLPSDIQEESFENVTQGMDDAKLPYDGDCVDARLTYPDPFESIPRWAQLKVTDLINSGRKFLAVSYPFVVNGTECYTNASDADVLIKRDDAPYFGSIANSAVGYPDYMDSNSYNNWLGNSAAVAERFRSSGGAILLQNSPLNEAIITFAGNGSMCKASHPEWCCSPSGLQFSVDPSVEDVSDGTICWNATHASLDHSKHLAHHNAYGLYHTKRVHELMTSLFPEERPVVLSSSTHPGSGQYGGQFSEGFGITVDEQRRALQHVLQLGLVGVTLVGTPPCGSRNDTDLDPEYFLRLCLGSYQMSLFFPFLMSHYEFGHTPNNPPDISQGFAMQLRPLMQLRYTLLPTLYSLAEEASREGTPIIRPLHYEFPDDENSRGVSDQFMVGSSILVVPNFENTTSMGETVDVPVYFPPGYWYSLFSGLLVSNSKNGSYNTIPTVFSDVNAFLRGGEALFLQGTLHSDIKHSGDSRNEDFTVVVAVQTGQNNNISKGSIYHDDGRSLLDSEDYRATRPQAILKYSEQLLIIKRTPVFDQAHIYCNGPGLPSTTVTKAIIFGLPKVKQMRLVDDDVPSYLAFDQDEDTMSVQVPNLAYNWCRNAIIKLIWTYDDASYTES